MPDIRTRRVNRGIYAVFCLLYPLTRGIVLMTAVGVPLSRAALAAVANGLPAVLLGWPAIRLGAGLFRRQTRKAVFVAGHLAGAAGFALAIAFGTWLLYFLFDRIRLGVWDWTLGGIRPLFWEMMIGVLLYAMLALLGHSQALMERLRQEEARAAQARELAARSQLEALRARLDPHFLYNTLHSLLALVRRNPSAAEEGLERFGDLLHFSLRTRGAQLEEVTLAEERTLVVNYLKLESLRLAERLIWQESFQPDALSCRIPAFTLQPLVENAVRHAIAPRAAGGRLRVSGRIEGEELVLEVVDDGPGADPTEIEDGGLGLALVRDRLQALHGQRARLSIRTAPGRGLTVRVTLPALNGRKNGMEGTA